MGSKPILVVFAAFLSFWLGVAHLQGSPGQEDRILKALETSKKDPRAAFEELDGIKGVLDVSDAPLLRQALVSISKAYSIEAMELFVKFEPALALEDDAAFTEEMAKSFDTYGLGLKAMELYEKSYRAGASDALVPLVKLLESYGEWDRILSLQQDMRAYGKRKGQKNLLESLGRAYLKQGNPREALPELLRAGPSLSSYMDRAAALMELGHTDAADDSFSLALDEALRENNPEGIRRAILLKAQNLERAKRYDQAASHYGLFVEKFPKDPSAEWAKMRGALALLETGHGEQARSWFLPLTKSKDKEIAAVARALLGYTDISMKDL